MKIAGILGILSVCTLNALAVGSPISNSPDDFDLDDSNIFIPEWEVKAFPDGEPVVLNGTVEEVHAQLIQLNPNWDNDFPETETEQLETRDAVSSALHKRTDFWNSKYKCFGKFGRTPSHIIANGVSYLRRVKGHPRSPAGPNACGRVSCSYNSGIYWCNDSKKKKVLNSFGSIADGAQYIKTKCSLDSGITKYTAGQVTHKTNWRVIVKEVKC